MPSHSWALPKYKTNLLTKSCRIVFKDALKCEVRLERLTDEAILAATKYNGITNKPTSNLPSYELDHNYSRASFISRFLNKPKPVILQNSVHTNNTNNPRRCIFESSDDSSEYDDDDSDQNSDFNGYYSNAENVAYPIIVEYNSDKIDGFENTNSFKFDETHSFDEDSGISEKPSESSEQSLNMDIDELINSEVEGEDDDDMRFLFEISKNLDQSKDEEVNLNCSSNGELWPSQRIFGEICLKYLRNECFDTICHFAHELPTAEIVKNRLSVASRQDIEVTQNQILLRHDNLLNEYLPVFCTHYGRDWQIHRESLRQLIPLLSLKTSAQTYLKEILNGFLISGVPYTVCVQILLLEMDDSLNSDEQFAIMWEIIIDERNESVDAQLKDFEHTILYGDEFVSSNAINRILQLQTNGDLECIREQAITFIKKSKVTTFHKIDKNLLKQYIWHVRSFNLKASNEIQQKAKQFGVNLEN